jgi:hypothetical protein
MVAWPVCRRRNTTVYAAGKRRRAARVGERTSVQGGDPKLGRGPRVAGRPAFGLGPIARVSTVPAPGAPAQADRFVPTGVRDPQAGPGVGFGVRPAPGYGQRSPAAGPDPARIRAFGLPNLRRNVCPHFYVTGARGAIPIHAPHLLKGLVRQDSAVSRCQLRGGVHLEQSYVNDVCLSPRFNQCVFYEEDLSER